MAKNLEEITNANNSNKKSRTASILYWGALGTYLVAGAGLMEDLNLEASKTFEAVQPVLFTTYVAGIFGLRAGFNKLANKFYK